MNVIFNLINPSFTYRIRKSFSQVESIEIPGILSVSSPYLELTQITDKSSTNIVKLNICKNTATWNGILLNPKDIDKYIKEMYSDYNSNSGKLVWFGFDLDKKYFIIVFTGSENSHKVIYWIPTKNNYYKVISEFDMLPGSHIEGKFIELVNERK